MPLKLSDIRRAIADEKARIDAARETIIRSESRIVALEAAARTFGEEQGLQSIKQRSTMPGTMETLTDSHRRNISATRTAASKDAEFLKHIRSKGYTLRSLATKLGVSPSMLSLNRRTHACPKDRADEIKKLTGWPADAKHWPAGISS